MWDRSLFLEYHLLAAPQSKILAVISEYPGNGFFRLSLASFIFAVFFDNFGRFHITLDGIFCHWWVLLFWTCRKLEDFFSQLLLWYYICVNRVFVSALHYFTSDSVAEIIWFVHLSLQTQDWKANRTVSSELWNKDKCSTSTMVSITRRYLTQLFSWLFCTFVHFTSRNWMN